MTETKDTGCEQALKYLLEYMDREIADHVREDIERHLKTCRSCFSRFEFEQRLKEHLLQLGDPEVPDSLWKRIDRIIGKY